MKVRMKKMLSGKINLFFLLSLLAPITYAGQAAVAMPDQFSAKVAQNVLQNGGNAVDASVAAAFVLAVTFPEAGNLGGGGFMTLYAKQTDIFRPKEIADKRLRPYFLDYREKAPKAASRDMYLDAKKQVIPYRSLVGYQASGVPGTVKGLWAAHQTFGSKPWAELLQPAISYAEKGFKVSKQLAGTAKWYQGWIANKSKQPWNFKRYFSGLKAGKTFIQPDLAATLKR